MSGHRQLRALNNADVSNVHTAMHRRIGKLFARFCLMRSATELVAWCLVVGVAYLLTERGEDVGRFILVVPLALTVALALIRASALARMAREGRSGERVMCMMNTVSCARSMPLARRVAYMTELSSAVTWHGASALQIAIVAPAALLLHAVLACAGFSLDMPSAGASVFHVLLALWQCRLVRTMYSGAVLDSVDSVLGRGGTRQAHATSACNALVNRQLSRMHNETLAPAELSDDEADEIFGDSKRSTSGCLSRKTKSSRREKKRSKNK